MNIKSYRDLIAWQKGLDFCELVYRASSRFPREEMDGLTSLEVETQLIVAQRLGYLDSGETNPLLELTNEIGRITNGLIRSLTRPL